MTSTQFSEFIITRPYGHSRFFTKMWEYPLIIFKKKVGKLLRSPTLLNKLLVLNIGCGGGLEAQFLAKYGAKVVGIDIASLPCESAIERFSRHGLAGVFIQGDANNLPFCDLAFDMVITHDSLHHLPKPQIKKAIEEFCRVSKKSICLLEPNNSILTKFLVVLGISSDVEPSGNEVIRFNKGSLKDLLVGNNYHLLAYTSFFNIVSHYPKHLYKTLMSRFPFFNLYFGLLAVVNFLFGNLLGNGMIAILTRKSE